MIFTFHKMNYIYLLSVSFIYSLPLSQVKVRDYYASTVHIGMTLKFTAQMRVVCRYYVEYTLFSWALRFQMFILQLPDLLDFID